MMRRLVKGFRKGEKGFTLIELLVVIAILGIIAAIVVPNFASFFGRGQTEACEIELRMVQTATMAYVADNGACPADTAALEAANYFQPGSTLTGTYTIASDYPDCTVTQTACP
jgi:type IV pilus assembly protein PilA